MSSSCRRIAVRASFLFLFFFFQTLPVAAQESGGPSVVRLPEPQQDGGVSLEVTLARRRSVRDYKGGGLSLAQVAQLLWAAQGQTHPRGLRTAPSAGATYPLELYVAAGDVENLEPGVYRYRPKDHTLILLRAGDVRQGMARASYGQGWVATAPVLFIITADFRRTTGRYGARGEGYVFIEAGCASQNIALEAVALGLGSVIIGAFDDAGVKMAAGLPEKERPLLYMPVGVPD